MLIERFPAGTPVTGVVTDRQQYGVWVALDQLPSVPALLEVIHFDLRETHPDMTINFSDDYPSLDTRLDLRILAWCTHPKDVRLTQLSHLNPSHTQHLRETNP